MYRTVIFHKTTDGKCPVMDFINSQSKGVFTKIAWTIRLIQEERIVPVKYFKKLTGTDFYECRIEYEGNIYRLLGFFDEGNLVILTNGFQKKSQKTPRKEIKLCKNRMQEYLQHKGEQK